MLDCDWSSDVCSSDLMRAVGNRMIIAPPLVITRAQIDEMVALIRRCLDLTLADARREGWI
jgi:putrescine aminotransferase